MPDLIDTAEAARILGFEERRSVSRLCTKGIFKTARQQRPGWPWEISRAEVEAYAKRVETLSKTDPRRGGTTKGK